MNKMELLLTQLSEECAKIQKIASKAIRFGLMDRSPKKDEINLVLLKLEYNDLIAVISCINAELLSNLIHEEEDLVIAKIKKIEKYLKLSKELGILNE